MNDEIISEKEDTLKERIDKLEKIIERRNLSIAALVEANRKDENELNQIIMFLDAVENNRYIHKLKKKSKSHSIPFLTLDNCENAGLFNKKVVFPAAECLLHNCKLSYEDVHKRNCAMRMCKHLKWI